MTSVRNWKRALELARAECADDVANAFEQVRDELQQIYALLLRAHMAAAEQKIREIEQIPPSDQSDNTRTLLSALGYTSHANRQRLEFLDSYSVDELLEQTLALMKHTRVKI